MPTLIDSFAAVPDNARRVYLTGYSRVGQSWTGQAGFDGLTPLVATAVGALASILARTTNDGGERG